jgi:tetratricopeptide (TPR) repeat protein
MPIILASGAAGIGKTALAVHWAHRVRDRFPDGQLYLDLRGYSAGPSVRPLQALTHFLRALGTPAEQIPMDLEQASALYRTLLADKRILVVLDNVSTVDQVRPLLPAGTGCVAVITSRDRLGGLVAREGAHRVTLDVLSPAEACDLLAGILGTARVSAEPAAAIELATTCACLPLALRIAAANLIGGPERTIAGYVRDLREGNRLAALAVDGDEEAAVRGAFDLSYAALKPPARELFQLLGLMPGQDIDTDAASALAGTPAADALKALAGAHLVQRSEPGRFTFHDLLRFYAGELAQAELGEPDRRAAITRLGEFYLSTSDAAARLLYPHMQRLDTGLPERGAFPDAAAANRWLETERANLVATTEHFASEGPRPVAWLLADTLRGYFWLRRHGADWLTVAGAGLDAARRGDNRLGQAAAHLSLAQAHRFHTAYADAVDHFSTARALAGAAGWLAGEASALGSLGNVYRDQGLLEKSVEQHAMAREVFQRLGERGGEAISLGNLGNVEWERGRLSDALRWYREALAGYTEVGSLTGQAFMLNGLGNVFHELGRFDEAEEHLGRALAVSRAAENREGEADTLSNLGELRCSTGRPAEAGHLAGDALTIAREVGDRRIEADALTTLGTARQLSGHPAEAEEYHRAALRLATESGYRRGQVRALIHLATAELALGRRTDALTNARRAHDLADRLGYRRLADQAAALT